jgi:menaquinone-dependent protoporphyrinogen IX oxidase
VSVSVLVTYARNHGPTAEMAEATAGAIHGTSLKADVRMAKETRVSEG